MTRIQSSPSVLTLTPSSLLNPPRPSQNSIVYPPGLNEKEKARHRRMLLEKRDKEEEKTAIAGNGRRRGGGRAEGVG